MPKRTGSARIGSWNVRWFPDGKPGKRPAAEGGVDLEWLACAIAYLNVDALAVQEMKATPHARQALDRVLASLGRHMGGKWQTELDACDNLAGQHVGVLWNTARARAKPGVVLPSLNAHGEACKDQLRPGMSVHLDFGPLDFHLVSVHAKSGTKRRDLELRARALAGLDAARRVLAATDEDVIVAGDFNTMGCRHCSPRVEAARELEDFDRALAAQSAPLVRLPASEACSQAYGPHGALLDHVLVSARLFPRVVAGRATISGFCAAEACRLARQPPAESALSDHCPVLVDITLGP